MTIWEYGTIGFSTETGLIGDVDCGAWSEDRDAAIIKAKADDGHDPGEVLNIMGQEGWELVTSVSYGDGTGYLILKRPKGISGFVHRQIG